MGSSRRLRNAVSASALLSCVACALVSGLDQLHKEACVGVCADAAGTSDHANGGSSGASSDGATAGLSDRSSVAADTETGTESGGPDGPADAAAQDAHPSDAEGDGTRGQGQDASGDGQGDRPDSGQDASDSSAIADGNADAPSVASDAQPEDATGPDAGCSDPLGSIWHEIEAQGACTSTWTRQGSTSTFAAVYGNCNVTATVMVTVNGKNIVASRTGSSDGNNCKYMGTFNTDCTAASGTYSCTVRAGGPWSSTISR